jgi:hypothetical protein
MEKPKYDPSFDDPVARLNVLTDRFKSSKLDLNPHRRLIGNT